MQCQPPPHSTANFTPQLGGSKLELQPCCQNCLCIGSSQFYIINTLKKQTEEQPERKVCTLSAKKPDHSPRKASSLLSSSPHSCGVWACTAPTASEEGPWPGPDCSLGLDAPLGVNPGLLLLWEGLQAPTLKISKHLPLCCPPEER